MMHFNFSEPKKGVKPLVELASQCVALYIPYELVEQEYPPVPEELQVRIAFWSFPDNEDDIRLYSCLANSNADEFLRGQNLYSSNMVKDSVQIGFHLSANVHHGNRSVFNVAITFDRKKITTCNCTCEPMSYWCSHVVAVCLHRIYYVRQFFLFNINLAINKKIDYTIYTIIVWCIFYYLFVNIQSLTLINLK